MGFTVLALGIVFLMAGCVAALAPFAPLRESELADICFVVLTLSVVPSFLVSMF